MSFGASPFASSPFADAGTEKYEIGAVGITTSSPVVDNANITAGNVFVGAGITLGAPTIAQSTIVQTNILTANTISTNAPDVADANMSEGESLSASELLSATSVFSTVVNRSKFIFFWLILFSRSNSLALSINSPGPQTK